MSVDPALLPLLGAMAAASFACRAGGFWFMRFVPATKRIEAALRATPLAVMVGIAAPAAARGNLAEIAALALLAIVVRTTGNDLVAALAGVIAVAALRLLG